MKIRNVAIAAVALLVPFTAAACGGSDKTSDLNKTDLAKELEKRGMSEGSATCAAEALLEAGFTRAEIDKQIKGDGDVDADKVQKFTAALARCGGGGGAGG